MKKLFIALTALCMLAGSAVAEETTVLIFQGVEGQEFELGPTFKEKFIGLDVDVALLAILSELPSDTAVCVATKTHHGMNFIIGESQAQTTFSYYGYIDDNGSFMGRSLNENSTLLAESLTMTDATHIVWAIVPQRALAEDVSPCTSPISLNTKLV